MSRGQLLAVWAIFTILLLIGILVLFKLNGNQTQEIATENATLLESEHELENVSRLSALLEKLDKLTINENTATRLEILRHLEMEKNDYDINIGGKAPLAVGSTTLTKRAITLNADLPYAKALALADQMYNNGRMNVIGVNLTNTNSTSADAEVHISIGGILYGLEKREVPQ